MLESLFNSFKAAYLTSVIWLVLAASISSFLNLGFISFYIAIIGLITIWYNYSLNVEDTEEE